MTVRGLTGYVSTSNSNNNTTGMLVLSLVVWNGLFAAGLKGDVSTINNNTAVKILYDTSIC